MSFNAIQVKLNIFSKANTNTCTYVHRKTDSLAKIKFCMVNLKTMSVHTESRISRTAFTGPCCLNFIS